MELFSMNKKVNEYFSKFYFIKLDEFGEDHENYGDMIINGRSHAPFKININYILQRAKKKELEKIRNKKSSDEIEKIIIDDNYSEFNFGQKNIIKRFEYLDLNLPLLKTKNKNKSMQNLIRCNSEFNIDTELNKKDEVNNLFLSDEIKRNNTYMNFKNINSKNKNRINKIKKNKEKKNEILNKNSKHNNSLPKIKNKIFITRANMKAFIQTNKSEMKTEINKRNHILKRNAFLRRYDKKEGINRRLKELNDGLIKLNNNITKIIRKSDEDIPQFNLRFNHLLKKLKFPPKL